MAVFTIIKSYASIGFIWPICLCLRARLAINWRLCGRFVEQSVNLDPLLRRKKPFFIFYAFTNLKKLNITGCIDCVAKFRVLPLRQVILSVVVSLVLDVLWPVTAKIEL